MPMESNYRSTRSNLLFYVYQPKISETISENLRERFYLFLFETRVFSTKLFSVAASATP